MAWLRFGTVHGLNMDECAEWRYEERPVSPAIRRFEATAPGAEKPGDAKPAAGTPAPPSATAPAPTGGPAPSVPTTIVSDEVLPEPPETVPTLTLLMRDGREVLLEGDEATKAMGFLVATTGAL